MKIKKIALVFMISITTLFLSSCQVNWFGKHYDVPWWVIAVPVTVFSLIILITVGKHIASKKYVCPECNKSFRPKLTDAILSVHVGDDRLFKCPYCGKRSFCHVSREYTR